MSGVAPVLGFSSSTVLAAYNQAAIALTTTQSVQPIPTRTVRGQTLYIEPRGSLSLGSARFNSVNAALSAGLIQQNLPVNQPPADAPGAAPAPPDAAGAEAPGPSPDPVNRSSPRALADAGASGSGPAFDGYDVVPASLSISLAESASVPLADRRAQLLRDTYLTLAQQTPPSTASTELLQWFADQQGRAYGLA